MAEKEELSSAGKTEDEREKDLEHRQELIDEHRSDDLKCSECGEPVDNLRKTCPNCGHEYSEEENDDPEAGTEFKAGTALDEEGNEVTEEGNEVPAEDDDATGSDQAS